jgi:hypothetical protein
MILSVPQVGGIGMESALHQRSPRRLVEAATQIGIARAQMHLAGLESASARHGGTETIPSIANLLLAIMRTTGQRNVISSTSSPRIAAASGPKRSA